jgi:hypothetical protein
MEEKKEKQKNWGVGQVPTEFKTVVAHNKTQKAYTIEEALAELLNKLTDLKIQVNNILKKIE